MPRVEGRVCRLAKGTVGSFASKRLPPRDRVSLADGVSRVSGSQVGDAPSRLWGAKYDLLLQCDTFTSRSGYLPDCLPCVCNASEWLICK